MLENEVLGGGGVSFQWEEERKLNFYLCIISGMNLKGHRNGSKKIKLLYTATSSAALCILYMCKTI